jgi:hypothetical protein
MFDKDKETRSHIVTVRLNEKENRDLEELAQFFGVTKSDVLADGMRMVRDLKQVIAELLHEDPDLAHVLRDSLIPGILNASFRREKVGEVAEKVLIGLIRKDFVGAGRRARLVLKLFQE